MNFLACSISSLYSYSFYDNIKYLINLREIYIQGKSTVYNKENRIGNSGFASIMRNSSYLFKLEVLDLQCKAFVLNKANDINYLSFDIVDSHLKYLTNLKNLSFNSKGDFYIHRK